MFEKRELTYPFLKTVKAEEGRRREVFDTGFEATGSLCLRVSAATGKKVFTFVYRNLTAKQRRYRIGSYPRVSLAAARKKARSLAARVTLGEDPAQDRWKEKLAARDAMSFKELSRFPDMPYRVPWVLEGGIKMRNRMPLLIISSC